MGEPKKAEAIRGHFATIVSPSLAMTPFGSRQVPTAPAVSLEYAVMPAMRTNGNSAPLFLLRSMAIDPITGKNFVPEESILTNPVEGSFATAHGHMGMISGVGMTPVPGAINTGVLVGPNADCSAQFAGLINALAEQMAKEFMADPLSFLVDFNRASDAATLARLGEYADKTSSFFSRAWEWTKGAASSSWNYVASGEILSDAAAAGGWVVDKAGQAWDYTASGEILTDIKNGAISAAEGAQALYEFVRDINPQDVIDACKEWLMETLGELACSLVGVLRELLADPRPMSEKLGEMYGTAKAEVAVTAAQVGAAVVADVLVTKGAASAASRLGTVIRLTSGRMGNLSDKIFDRINARRAGTPKPNPDAPASTPNATTARAATAADDAPPARTPNKDAVEQDANGRPNVVCPIC